MKGYYDKILPGRLKEILKKLGHEAKFEPLTIKHPKDDAGRTEHTLHSVPLPPELREKILKGCLRMRLAQYCRSRAPFDGAPIKGV